MNFYLSSIIGVFLGFGFGVGCALAGMYSIYAARRWRIRFVKKNPSAIGNFFPKCGPNSREK
jgi:hypothetical protein